MLVLILCSCTIFSQDKDISESNYLKFQEHFFDAITQKAINNYTNAIDLLEECNSLIPNNTAVLFELSKNYLQLNKTAEAIEYINEALTIEPDNIWLQEHIVKTYKKEKNYEKAIDVQEKIAEKYPKKRQEVVYLHLRNKDNTAAKKVLEELSAAKLLNGRLRRIKERLTTTPKKVTTVSNTKNVESSVEETYLKDKSFTKLKKLLEKLDKENQATLLKYSDEGMALFPAQPYVYLMNGKALNRQKKHNKAIKSLQNGIDFVIDDVSLEKRFYTQLLIAYKALGDNKNVLKYQKKI